MSAADMSIGDRIRYYRRRRGLSQAQLADRIGKSESWLSQVERGVRNVDRLSVIIAMTNVLKVNVTDLTGQPYSLAPNGGATPSGLTDLRNALTRYDEIPRILNPGRPGDVDLPSLVDLRRDVDLAWHMRQASRYTALAVLLPRLVAACRLAARELAGDQQREADRLLAETYLVVRAVLRKLGDTKLAWVAADRAIVAAERAEEPLWVAAGARAVGQVLLSEGLVDQAQELSVQTAASLERSLRDPRPEELSAWGSLLLNAAIAAARRDDRASMRAYLTEAQAAADRLGEDRNDMWTSFGPSNVAIHAVSAAVELGDAVEVEERAKRVDLDRLPKELHERRAQLLLDLARAYVQRRLDAAAVNTLLRAEEEAPEEVRFSVVVRELARQLLRREHQASTPQLRPLAQRLGVLEQ